MAIVVLLGIMHVYVYTSAYVTGV